VNALPEELRAGAGLAFREPGLWSSVVRLLWLRVRITFNEFKRAKLRRKIGYIAMLLLVLGVAGMLLAGSFGLLVALRSPRLAAVAPGLPSLVEIFPVMVLSAATVGILLTSFSVLLQGLYLSGDMEFLMCKPLPVRAIFIAKLVEAILPNFGMMCLFGLPALFGLGISGGYHLLYYPAVLLTLAALTLAAAGAASLLVLAAVRIFPARRLAEVLGFATGISIFLFSQSSQLIDFDVNAQQMGALLGLAARFDQPWSPLAWAGRALEQIGQAQWLSGLGLLAAVLGLAGGVFYLSLATAERLYHSGWSSLQNNRRKAKAPAQARAERLSAASGLLDLLLSRPVRALIAKDWTLYRRDLRSMSRLITPLIMGVVYAVSLIRSGGQIPDGRGEAPLWFMETLKGIYLYGDVALSLFVGWLLAVNLAGSGLSLEGKNFWMLKASPLRPRQLLAAKYLAAYIPALLVCSIYDLVLQILKGSDLWTLSLSLAVTALILAGVNGLYLGFGVSGARFDWDNPNQVGRTVSCLGGLAGMAYVPFCFTLFAGPPLLAGFLDLPLIAGQLAGLGLGGLAGLAGALVPLLLVERRVPTLNEA